MYESGPGKFSFLIVLCKLMQAPPRVCIFVISFKNLYAV